MTIAIALDLLVATLLVATITYAVILNRKLARLRMDRAAFEQMLKDFAVATQRAEHGVALLQKTAATSAAELDSKRDGAVTLRNDLEFLVARAGEQADRLDALIARGRDREMPRVQTPEPEQTPAPAPKRREGGSIFDRLRETDKSGLAHAEDIRAEHASAANDLVDDVKDVPAGVTPTWLQAARRVAGREAGLR